MTTVREIMSGLPICVDPRATVQDAVELAERQEVRHLVVMKGGDLVGVACLCDLEPALPDDAIHYWMSSPVVAISSGSSLAEAADALKSYSIGCLPVVESGTVVGILTRTDLLSAGMLHEELAHACEACGDRRHVREMPGSCGVLLCHRCRDRTGPADEDEELGAGD
jgi:predicted transcriptional regulator